MRKIKLRVPSTQFANGGKKIVYLIEIDRDRGFLHVRQAFQSETATITLEDLARLVMSKHLCAKARNDA